MFLPKKKKSVYIFKVHFQHFITILKFPFSIYIENNKMCRIIRGWKTIKVLDIDVECLICDNHVRKKLGSNLHCLKCLLTTNQVEPFPLILREVVKVGISDRVTV